ncbi:sensor histidine kinase [uncultured Granulicatella sp.]|uniref:sensor histidine kinase n=1 Tax=uncultured Granulicatella sp. TaxID=316089 RepID=UPI0028E33299|nr:sensor histidine kinase [uncultured Granulicatella sp.]
MKIIQENQLKFLIRYGLLITALVEWALYHSVNAYHLLLFLLIVIVAQLDYYSIQYPWAILAQGMAVLAFCYFTGNIFISLMLLLCFEISFRFSSLHAIILQGMITLVVIVLGIKQQQWWSIPVMIFGNVLFYYGAHLVLKLNDQENLLKEQENQLFEQKKELQQAQYTMGTMKELYTLQERNRISREIHDSVGHSLSTIIIQLGAISKLSEENNPQISQMSSQLREFAVKGLQEVRTVVHDLKPEQLTKQQLTVALEEFIYETKQHSGVEFVFRQNKPTFQLTKEQELTIFRGVQEATTNAIRHGKATKITLLMMYSANELIVTIMDNGVGSSAISLEGGLKALEERLHEQQAQLEIKNTEQGFTVQMKLKGETNV